jgi:hypothetical protein
MNDFGKHYMKAVMVVAGGFSGGFSSSIAGGDFMSGFRQGVITAGLNHVAHIVAEGIGKITLTKELMKKIWDAYPKASDYKDAKALYNNLIGGKLRDLYNDSVTNDRTDDDHSWENTCAARMSRALNYAGILIPDRGPSHTLKGDDGMNYFFKVADLKIFLENTFTNELKIMDFSKQQPLNGAIYVQGDCGWTNATGHFDVFYKGQVGSHFFPQCGTTSVWLPQ